MFLLFVFIFSPACLCASLVRTRVLHDWTYRGAFVNGEAGIRLMCCPSDPCIIYSLSSLSSPPFLHIVPLCFSWHHGSSLSLSVYRRCIKYRAIRSIYLRKYISTQIQVGVCLIIYKQPKMTEGICNLHVGPTSAPLEGPGEVGRRFVQWENPQDGVTPWCLPVCQSCPHHLTPSCAIWPWLQYLTTCEKSPLIS